MKITQLVALILAWTVTTAAAAEFEGLVHFKNTRDSRVSEFDYFVKGDKSRMEMEDEGHGGKAAVIVDLQAKTVLMLMADQKMAMEMPLTESQMPKAEKATGELLRTGKTQKLLGYTAEQLLYKTADGETEIWGAKGLGFFGGMHGGPGTGGQNQSWAQDLKTQGFFPLLVINRDRAGREHGRMEATKVEKKALPDGLFMAPPDYKKFDRGMLPGMGAPRTLGRPPVTSPAQ